MTNTGGRLPTGAVRALRGCQPDADLVLMYGLTEAFRSTYLSPDMVDRKPESIGRAIPGAEILVVRDDRTPRSEEHTSELQSLMRITYAVFGLKQKIKQNSSA